MFEQLEQVNSRPAPFQFYTAKDLWTNEHTSKKMLEYHLDGSVDISSRNRDFIERSVEWIVSRFGVGANTVIADFGCGPGLYTTALAEHGATVTGIDFSARSIRYAAETAARRKLTIEYVCQDYVTFETDQKFDLITMIMCDFCALSPAQRRTIAAKFNGLLNSGGSVLLDVYSLNAFDQREETVEYEYVKRDGFWSPDPYHCFQNTFKYDREQVILDKYTIVEPTQTRTVFNWLQYFSPESIGEELEQSGFEVREYYGDVGGAPFTPDSAEFAVVAESPR